VEGDPVLEIHRQAAEWPADLIVILSRGIGGKSLLGSTAEWLCRSAPSPVLVVHPIDRNRADFTTNEIELRRVLIAYDFSEISKLAVLYGFSIAQELQAELHLLHVMRARAAAAQVDSERAAPGRSDGVEETMSRLQNVIPSDAPLWCEIKGVVREGDPRREILDYADSNQIDLICLGPTGAGLARARSLGSTVDRVLPAARCPVLVARPLGY
jgi:nucleotide-binding universal stress UspA family protein